MKRLSLFFCICLIGSLFASCGKKAETQFVLDSTSIESLTTAIQRDSLNPELYYLRANLYYDRTQMPEAGMDILEAIKLDDKQPKYYVTLADVNFAQRKTDDAEENLLKALDIDPQYNEARCKLAELYYLQEDFDRALATADEAIKQQPHNPKAYLTKAFCYKDLKDTTNYVGNLFVVKDQEPKNRQAHLELGYYCQQRLSPEGIEHYKNALQYYPKDQEINYNLALLYRDLGDSENAEAQFKVLLSYWSSGVYAVNAAYNLGVMELGKGKFSEAASYFTKAIEMDANFVDAYAARGEAYEQLGSYDQARADYEKCLTLVTNYQKAIDGLNALDKKRKK